MTLKELKEKILTYPNDTMGLCLGEPFSWRGSYDEQCVLSFKTPELRDEFLNNFRELIEIAKPLL